MPIENLHMTVLEVAHSKTESEISSLVARLGHKIEEITDLTLKYRLRLIKPMLSYDASAIALSFVPDGGGDINESARFTDEYTYHHLRRDVFSLCKESGIDIRSRYSVPSAHITISRFLDQHDISTKVDGVFKIDCNKTRAWVDALEMLNKWLQDTYWSNDQSPLARGQWAVGEECGLDCRIGTLWYGGGSSLRVGKGSGSIQSSLP